MTQQDKIRPRGPLRTAAAAAMLTLLCSAGSPEYAVFAAAPLAPVAEAASAWIVDEADNVCGVRPARQITNPASVRYDELMDATPEVQRMKREGISRESAQGQVLYAAAVDRVSRAAKRVMAARSHCSVWKQIRHSDGRAVPDISFEVKMEL